MSHHCLDIMCWPLLTCSGITWHNNTGNLMEKSHRHVQKHHINWWTSAAFPLFRILTDVLIFESISIDQLVAGANIPAVNCELKSNFILKSESRPQFLESFALPEKLFNPRYPEGNFGGNQLLEISISLSPLYPSVTDDLHVSIAMSLRQSFS